MNTNILIAVAIVAAAVILKLPIGPQPGRYQTTEGAVILIDTATGARWGWTGGNGWRQYSTGVTP